MKALEHKQSDEYVDLISSIEQALILQELIIVAAPLVTMVL